MPALKLKMSHDGVMRRAAAPDPLTFAAAADLAGSLFNIPPPSALTYRDDEGDVITVSSDVELREAADIPRSTVALKLDVVPVSPHGNAGVLDWKAPALKPTGIDTARAVGSTAAQQAESECCWGCFHFVCWGLPSLLGIAGVLLQGVGRCLLCVFVSRLAGLGSWRLASACRSPSRLSRPPAPLGRP